MAERVRLVDILSNQRLYGDVTNMFVDYKPDLEHISFGSKFTGFKWCQHAETETCLEWHPFMGEDGKLYLVSNPTEFQLYLYGKKGWKDGIKVLELYSSLYDKQGIGATGIPLTNELFDMMPEEQKSIKGQYWLAKNYKIQHRAFSYHIFECVDSGKKSTVQMFHSSKGGHIFRRSIRQVVHLPEDTKVIIGNEENDGSAPEKGLKLVATHIY